MAIPNSFQILQAVMEATPDAIFVKDLEGRYVLVNEAAARFLGKSPDEIIGKHDLELYPEETARQFIEDDRKVLESGNPHVFPDSSTFRSSSMNCRAVSSGYSSRSCLPMISSGDFPRKRAAASLTRTYRPSRSLTKMASGVASITAWRI